MALIPKETIDQIMQTADILEVVGDFVQLKRKGQSYSACCPFHNEKTPSFNVIPSKGFFKCFGCGKAGDAVRFIMEIEGSSYPEALKYLARKYGIEVKEQEKTPYEQLAQNERDSQFIVSDWAKNHYHRLLLDSEEGMSIGYGYLKERGLSLTTIQQFELGYSLDTWDELMKAATAAGYEQKYLEKTGLIVAKTDEQGQGTGRYYDRFRGRVMFPIHNIGGRVVGFGARTLKRDDKMAKYLNSPESDIYHKSDILYGLFQARQAIRNEDVCYLAEGYLDVISLHQGGVKNVVSSSGTSLTEGQIQLIQRYTKNVTVLYDGDPAGIKASLRGIDLLLKGGLNVQVVLFPDGEDPDSYIRKVGDQRFAEFVEKSAQEFISFKINLLKSEMTANGGVLDPVKRVELSRDILRSIANVSDPLKRQVFRTQTAEKLNLDEQTLISEYNKIETAEQNAARKAAQAAAERENRLSNQTGGSSNVPAISQSVGEPISADDYWHGQAINEAGEIEDVSTTVSSEEELEPVFDLLKACEREVLRLLILHAPREVDTEISVAAYLLSQLEDAPLKTPLYAEMWEICRQELLAGRFPDVRIMMQHERDDIRGLISDLATERYEISPNWRTKEIYVFNEVDLPKLACDNAVLRLNKCHVQRELNRAMDRLRLPGLDDAEMFEILGTIKSLKQLDNQLAGMLGTVIPRGA